MLNAFRHHGERDDIMTEVLAQNVECSTPSGITASGTLAQGASEYHRRQVLNAFRHHGERDAISASTT
ncbi:hypothetical protein ACLEPN_39440, partial [Myxococcus sp. 1LA]